MLTLKEKAEIKNATVIELKAIARIMHLQINAKLFIGDRERSRMVQKSRA